MPNQYSLDYFRNNSTLYSVAVKYDSATGTGNNDRILNGKEIQLFTNDLKQKGIDFNFDKIKDVDYLENIDKTYKKEAAMAKEREALIEEMKDDYTITKTKDENGNVFYQITAKKDVNLSKLKSDLKLPSGVVSENNAGYGQYDYNGHYIDNKPMKDVTIKVPERALGASKGVLESIWDWITGND